MKGSNNEAAKKLSWIVSNSSPGPEQPNTEPGDDED
jgi:hypothetical protein